MKQDRLAALEALEAQVARDLAYLDYPARPWVPPRAHPDAPVYDVVIVGGGQAGLATAFGLMREKVDNILVVDRNPAGQEGPWTTFARMVTLRTPKHLTGPDLGIPSLTPRAWFEARFGDDAWMELGKWPKEVWQDYLIWYRRVLDIPVRNEWDLVEVLPEGPLLRLAIDTPAGPRTLMARKLVLATGIDGAGRWHIPDFIRGVVPESRYAHTSEVIDFNRLRGKRIGVLGAGASAFDNAGTALEAGVTSVDLCLRRADIPRVNPYRWMEFSGFLGHFAAMPDIDRWRFMKHILDMNQPPPQDTFHRCARHPNFTFHTACPWEWVRMDSDGIHVATPKGVMIFDFLVVGTGFLVEAAYRPEVAAFANVIATWEDKFTPPPGEASAVLARYPYLGDAFQFMERQAGTAPYLANIHNFTFGATLSMGLSGASISGMKYGVSRLVQGVVRDLWMADRQHFLNDLRCYDQPELVSTQWPASPPISSTPATAAPLPASVSSFSASTPMVRARR